MRSPGPIPRVVEVAGARTRAAARRARGETAARARHAASPVATALAAGRRSRRNQPGRQPGGRGARGIALVWQGRIRQGAGRFAAAREQFDSGDAAKAAIAAFDQACAAHRKGDVAQAREWYLKAGLAHDKGLAASAHFNLGTLAAEEARRLAGEHPENVAAEKRPEILDQLKAAVASFRHCLELQPDNARARRDIELVRQWIKYYSDRGMPAIARSGARKRTWWRSSSS